MISLNRLAFINYMLKEKKNTYRKHPSLPCFFKATHMWQHKASSCPYSQHLGGRGNLVYIVSYRVVGATQETLSQENNNNNRRDVARWYFITREVSTGRSEFSHLWLSVELEADPVSTNECPFQKGESWNCSWALTFKLLPTNKRQWITIKLPLPLKTKYT